MNIELRNVSKSYRRNTDQIRILEHASVTINAGTSVAIVGPSGSGKTTLLSLIAGLDDPEEGSIMIGTAEMNRLSEDQRTSIRCAHIGIVFQRFHLIPTLTAIENIALPLEISREKFIAERSIEALRMVGLSNRADHLPSELSGGECQRVAIARALIRKPQILLADEPSGNLDATTGDSIMDLLFALATAQKSTIVLVTHNQRHAERCSRILTLQNARLVG